MRRPEVTSWLGDSASWRDVDQARERIEAVADRLEPPRASLAIVPNDTGVPVGTILAGKLGDTDEVEIGWWLHPDAHGHGWATEAAAAIHDRAVALGTPRVWAGMWPHNAASAAVCRRIGMTELGVLVDPWYGTVTYPLGRFFCTWPSDVAPGDDEHPLTVLERITATTELPDDDIEAPVGPHGERYPGA